MGGMNLKRILCLVLATLFMCNTAFAQTKPKKPKQPKKIESSVKIIPKEMKVINEYLQFTYRIPVIQGSKDNVIIPKVNLGFEKAALDFKNSLQEQAVEGASIAQKNGVQFNPFTGCINYKVTFNKNDILSIPMTFDSYTGGAHGSTVKKTQNISLKTGNEIKLGNIFKIGVNYKNIIIEEIKRQISLDPSIYFDDARGNINDIPSDQPFYIVNDGIVVYYGLYEIAPYASGIREFKIPFSLFQSGIEPQFLSK
jgi:hypothetical protein